MPHKPSKNPGALDDIRDAIAKHRYLESRHAQQRMCGEQINRLDIWHAIENGKRNTKKDTFDEEHGNWRYAIEGSNIDKDRSLRIIVVLNEDTALIITAFPL